MNTKLFRGLFPCLLVLAASGWGSAQNLPSMDSRLGEPRHLDVNYTFPEYHSKDEWSARAEQLRKQISVSAGLWPAPQKFPVKAVLFGKIDRGDHTVEKVYFESYPGFYVTGNLYRPKNDTGQPKKLPAVLCPHGHWTYGRLENTSLNSGPARAISFARQGYVAFSYDMVGYVDNVAISHKFADHNVTRREALWGINLLGLQLWNSIRSIDFLLTLPEVDSERIACTGESGGGTQTFLLAAVDQRVKVAAPVNMVSFIMQGGSLCENAPNLRIDTNNVEIAALMAPRPMILVSATGDWTKNMLTSEYPAVRNIYRLLGAEDKVTAMQVNAPHNYNQESREAVYGWFAHSLLARAETTPIKERNAGVPSLSELLVFFGRQRPADELNEVQLTKSLIEQRKKQIEEALPRDATGLQRFKEEFGEAFRFSLMAENPKEVEIVSKSDEPVIKNNIASYSFVISRKGRGDRVQVSGQERKDPTTKSGVLVLSAADLLTGDEAAKARLNRDALINSLVQSGQAVVTINNFAGNQQSQAASKYKFYTTYNRTDVANQVQDILTVMAFFGHGVRGDAQDGGGKPGGFSIVALDRAGAWALLARGLAPQIDRMLIDAAGFDNTSDEEFLNWLPIPGIRRAGDFTTAVTIAPLTPLLIHNTGDKFQTARFAEIYRRFARAEDFQSQSRALSNAEIINWLSAK
jgi:hypothetical protein